MKNKSLFKLFVVSSIFLFISGCAFGNRRPCLTYTPFSSSQPGNNITLRVIPFEDSRQFKDTVGYSRNGFGMPCAKVIPQNSVTEWVTSALKLELTNAGYNTSEQEDVSDVIEGEVLDIFCDTYMSYEGRAMLKVVLKKDGKVILDKNYSANKTGGINWAATASSFAKTLDETLQDVLRQVVFDINKELLEK